MKGSSSGFEFDDSLITFILIADLYVQLLRICQDFVRYRKAFSTMGYDLIITSIDVNKGRVHYITEFKR